MHYNTALIQLPLVRESTGQQVRTPEDVHRLCIDITELAQEAFQVISLDSRNQLINRHLVSLGLVDSSLVHPREVFRTAIENSASAIVLLHNHPSGDPEPSTEDIAVTHRLLKAGELLGVPLLDHLVLGGDAFVSLREHLNL